MGDGDLPVILAALAQDAKQVPWFVTMIATEGCNLSDNVCYARPAGPLKE